MTDPRSSSPAVPIRPGPYRVRLKFKDEADPEWHIVHLCEGHIFFTRNGLARHCSTAIVEEWGPNIDNALARLAALETTLAKVQAEHESDRRAVDDANVVGATLRVAECAWLRTEIERLTTDRDAWHRMSMRRLVERDAERADIDALRSALDLRMGEGLTLAEITAHIKALGVTSDHVKATALCVDNERSRIRASERIAIATLVRSYGDPNAIADDIEAGDYPKADAPLDDEDEPCASSMCEDCGNPAVGPDDADCVNCDCGAVVCSACCVAFEGESYCRKCARMKTSAAAPSSEPAPRGVLAELEHEIRRLRANPCPTMRFGFSPKEIADAVRSEVDEVVAEPESSERAREESAGVIAVAVHLAIVHGAVVEDVLAAEVRRLRRRLDHVEAGGTWVEAKAMERDALSANPTEESDR